MQKKFPRFADAHLGPTAIRVKGRYGNNFEFIATYLFSHNRNRIDFQVTLINSQAACAALFDLQH
jgi:hypothetical protein